MQNILETIPLTLDSRSEFEDTTKDFLGYNQLYFKLVNSFKDLMFVDCKVSMLKDMSEECLF